MTHLQAFQPDTLPAQAFFARLNEARAPLTQTLRLLSALDTPATGLGEVVCDFAHQLRGQLRTFLGACHDASAGSVSTESLGSLQSAGELIPALQSFVAMVPATMQRNRAEYIGAEQRYSAGEIACLAAELKRDADLQSAASAEGNYAGLLQALAPRTAQA